MSVHRLGSSDLLRHLWSLPDPASVSPWSQWDVLAGASEQSEDGGEDNREHVCVWDK